MGLLSFWFIGLLSFLICVAYVSSVVHEVAVIFIVVLYRLTGRASE